MLDLDAVDVEEIATALVDQSDYEHRWLIDPKTGEIAFWTSDTGIDGENPVDLDDLDLILIDPLLHPSGTRTWSTSPTASAIALPASACTGRCRARAASGASRASSTSAIPI